jgi:hypothetical protein
MIKPDGVEDGHIGAILRKLPLVVLNKPPLNSTSTVADAQ